MLKSPAIARSFPETSAKLIRRFSAFDEKATLAKSGRNFSALNSIAAANPRVQGLLDSAIIRRTYPETRHAIAKRFGVRITAS
jgi:hypothetical protein